MNKKYVKILILLITILITVNVCYAGEIDTEAFKGIYDGSDTAKIKVLGGEILGIVQVIAMATGVIMLIVLGIKYMVSSVEEKASIKQKLMPYIIGVFLVFAGTTFLKMIQDLTNEF